MQPMTPADVERIADTLATKIMDSKRAQWVDPETHADHHDWVKGRMASEKDIRELKKRIVMSACIWAVPLILAFLASAVWRDIVRLIKG